MSCDHLWGFRDSSGVEWMTKDVGAVDKTAPTRFCYHCGELWFRTGDGGWEQRIWTQDEIDNAKERGRQLADFLDGDRKMSKPARTTSMDYTIIATWTTPDGQQGEAIVSPQDLSKSLRELVETICCIERDGKTCIVTNADVPRSRVKPFGDSKVYYLGLPPQETAETTYAIASRITKTLVRASETADQLL